MKSKKTNNEINYDDVAIAIEVDNGVIEKVKKGEITHILTDINENNQELILETLNGNLLLAVDELPETYHGCHYYNDGQFPYLIKRSLDFLVLNCDDSECLVRIIDVETTAGKRFNYQGIGKPIVEDEDGDSCVWEVAFEVIPLPEKPNIYLMRWNPAISSFTEKDYEECIENQVHGMFRMNWSICEWEEARRGDMFYMMREGDDRAGILFRGQFISDPYPADDWAGTTKRRMYVDMICGSPEVPSGKPRIPRGKLQETIPDIDWTEGHSGILLPDGVVEMPNELFLSE